MTKEKMRIVFMGTPEFAVPCLEILIEQGYHVVAVVTVPDKPAGRGQQLHESAVKKFAVGKGIPVLQPEKLKDENFIEALRKYRADLQIVVAFRMLPEVVWDMPKMGTYNLHASLLPKYRGAAPINRAIMNGDHESGVTTFKLQHQIDTGGILFRQKVAIGPDMNAGELHDLLMQEGKLLLLKTVQKIEAAFSGGEELKFISQNDTEATHAPKIFKQDCQIKWTQTAEHIHNQVRGLSPYPGAFSLMRTDNEPARAVKIYRTKHVEEIANKNVGQILSNGKNYLHVVCGSGVLAIEELQMEGKKRMAVKEFLSGVRNISNCFFEA